MAALNLNLGRFCRRANGDIFSTPPGLNCLLVPIPRNSWIDSDRFIPSRFVRPALRLTHIEASSGIVLVVAAVVAFLWANLSFFGDSYLDFWHTHLEISVGPFHLENDLKHFVNDGLMALFFLVVGLEIKRELVLGELRNPRKALLPVVAALGGMIFPAAIYLMFNGGDSIAVRGWGIPMATDIAFSLGILALLGSRVPVGARLFLLAVAIADDIGAILVIAIFYTSDLNLTFLVFGLLVLFVMWVSANINIQSPMFFVPLGILAWYCFYESGVHATIAGVIIGFITPTTSLYNSEEYDQATRQISDMFPVRSTEEDFRAKVEYEARLLSDVSRQSIAPLSRLQHGLHNWSAFLIVPIFALANAGVRLGGIDILDSLTSNLAIGIGLGLVGGKTIGITGLAWLVAKLGLGQLPTGVDGRILTGVAMLGGVGFTVSLFIGELAFRGEYQPLLDTAKLGVFSGSIMAGLIGYLLLRIGTRKHY